MSKNGIYPGEETLKLRQQGRVQLLTLWLAIAGCVFGIVNSLYLWTHEDNKSSINRLIEALDRNTKVRHAPISNK